MVPAFRRSGVPLPDEAVGGGEDPVPMNEGTPTGVEEGGFWAARGPDLQYRFEPPQKSDIYISVCMSVRMASNLHGHLPGPGVRSGLLSIHNA